ncbi:GUN4 domain-containing protein [Argonema antarcticum]|uniref:GUN4 domain-containing protein n=1 Tax=Argonema antarcticum TaxID=2942763 RepID=UPI0023DFB9F6|nr:GUN4 domain-containing protein [Argonema antarcticum]
MNQIVPFAKKETMYQVTSEYAKNNFNEVIERAATEPGGVVIVRENQNFILISQEELDASVRIPQPQPAKIPPIPPAVNIPSAYPDDLNSDVEVDYGKMRDLLAAGKWKEADIETGLVMLKAARREKEGWLDSKSIKKFPCADLRTIDQLWVKYSKGRFGFSVQKRIWQEVGGKVDFKTECRLGDRVGWRKNGKWQEYDRLTFFLNAPLGHLPFVDLWRLGFIPANEGVWNSFLRGYYSGRSRMEVFSSLASRLVKCNL